MMVTFLPFRMMNTLVRVAEQLKTLQMINTTALLCTSDSNLLQQHIGYRSMHALALGEHALANAQLCIATLPPRLMSPSSRP